MFKKVFQALSKGFHAMEAPSKNQARPAAAQEKRKGSVLDKIAGARPAPAAGSKAAATAQDSASRPKTPEDLCGVTAKMSKDEIKQRLALLYRRYNRATSSLDAKLRAEAEQVLDAVVVIREKHFGPI